MPTFSLSVEFTLDGIGSASGIVISGNRLFLISDNANRLYNCDLDGKNLNWTELTSDGKLQIIPKKLKPDFETLTFHNGKLYAFGSGSTKNRNMLAVVDPVSTEVAKYDLSEVYTKMKAVAGIGYDDFNIEGIAFNKHWYFFQRGNGAASQNGIFSVSGDIVSGDCSVSYKSIVLEKCNGVASTFTDAISLGNKIWFLAAAEDSQSVYEDGEIRGSIIGCIDAETLEVNFSEKISDTDKFEGLAFLHENDTEISFLICEDNDTGIPQSHIYKLTVSQ